MPLKSQKLYFRNDRSTLLQTNSPFPHHSFQQVVLNCNDFFWSLSVLPGSSDDLKKPQLLGNLTKRNRNVSDKGNKLDSLGHQHAGRSRAQGAFSAHLPTIILKFELQICIDETTFPCSGGKDYPNMSPQRSNVMVTKPPLSSSK